MGEVWAAHHAVRGTGVAIKVVTSNRAVEEKYRDVFQREVQAVAALNHPGVVAIYDYGELEAEGAAKSLPWYAMELAQTSLGDVFVEDWPTLQRVLVEILDALAHAHARGVIHRDLKPENVLLTSDLSVKLTDFGMAHVVEESRSTGNVFGPGGGTPDFMAPEQFRGQWRRFGPWTDLYALGCMAWELTTGVPPFRGGRVVDIALKHMSESPPHLEAKFPVPPRFEVWLRQLMQKHPLDRYRRAADARWALIHDVAQPTGSRPVVERPPPSSPRQTVGPRDTWDMGASRRKSSASTLVATYGLTPPFPDRWQTDHVPAKLGGAGLGLFGIREIPFVDRDSERDRVWQVLRHVESSGENALVLVGGAAGVGRTRFAQWISRRADELGAATVLRAGHAPIANKRDGLSGAIVRHLGIEGVEAERAEDITLDRLGPQFDPRPLFDVLFGTRGEHSSGRTSTFIAPMQRYAAVEKLFAHLSRERPVILFADDVQWGADTLLFVQHLLKARTRTLVVATVREDTLPERYWEGQLVEELLRNPRALQFQLGALGSEERMELIDQMLELERDLARLVARRSHGIPMFAVQVVGDWVQRDMLVDSEDGFRLRDSAATALPEDVFALWQQRIEELSMSVDEPRIDELLMVAAVLGRGDDREWREACTTLGLTIPANFVDELVTRRLAHREENGWSFQHGMLREAMEQRVEESDAAAAIYAACARAADPSDPYRVAELQVRAGDYDEAIDSLVNALRAGTSSVGVDQSLQLVELIRDLFREVRATAHDERRGAVAEAQIRLTRTAGYYAEARRLAAELVKDAVRFSWRSTEAEARLHLGMLGQILNEPRDAVLREFDEALTIYDELDDDLGRARAYRELARYNLVTGQPDSTKRLTSKALKVLESAHDYEGTVDCRLMQAEAALALGDRSEAEREFESALQLAREHQVRHLEAAALDGLGLLSRFRGKANKAEDQFFAACELWSGVGSPLSDQAATHLALLHFDQMEFDEAGDILDDVAARVPAGTHHPFASTVWAGMMAVAAHRGTTRVFDAYRERLMAATSTRGMWSLEPGRLAFLAGTVWAKRKDRARARSCFDIARHHFLAIEEEKLADDVARAIGRLAADP